MKNTSNKHHRKYIFKRSHQGNCDWVRPRRNIYRLFPHVCSLPTLFSRLLSASIWPYTCKLKVEDYDVLIDFQFFFSSCNISRCEQHLTADKLPHAFLWCVKCISNKKWMLQAVDWHKPSCDSSIYVVVYDDFASRILHLWCHYRAAWTSFYAYFWHNNPRLHQCNGYWWTQRYFNQHFLQWIMQTTSISTKTSISLIFTLQFTIFDFASGMLVYMVQYLFQSCIIYHSSCHKILACLCEYGRDIRYKIYIQGNHILLMQALVVLV